ncbi:E3 ubiquitin-protein ligase RNF144 [Microdochium nivale]|nr:E3 ubiquitin-protein ligase RNF144 [Microdochium nivale]
MGIFTQAEIDEYRNRLEEMTNPKAKLYCHNTECGIYIPNTNHGPRVGTCTKCNLKTCKVCHHKSHFGKCDSNHLDSEIRENESLLRLAESRGWKKCPNCSNLVQKNGGCDELLCSCGQTFCYACGLPRGSYHNCHNRNPPTSVPGG